MGLLDQLMAYVEANTPRNTRPAVSPLNVIDRGLLGSRIEQMPQRAEEIKQGLLRVPADMKQLGGPEMNQMVQGAYANPTPEGFDREKGMQMAMDFLQTSTPVGGLAGMFIGKGAKTWDAIAAQQADDLLKQGIDPREVWKQTGTLKGVDGALRQEIPDNLSALETPTHWQKFAEQYRSSDTPMDTALSHERLYQSYPDTAGIDFSVERSMPKGHGAYKEQSDRIQLGSGTAKKTMHSNALHELQHAIQQREGWARGGSPENALDEWYGNINGRLSEIVKGMDEIPEWIRHTDPQKASAYQALRSEYDKLLDMKLGIGDGKPDAHEMYRRLAGEAEARLTQARMGMNMDERLASYPYDMLDVPQEQLIVRGLLK